MVPHAPGRTVQVKRSNFQRNFLLKSCGELLLQALCSRLDTRGRGNGDLNWVQGLKPALEVKVPLENS